MKKFLNFLLVICLIVPSLLLLTACGETSEDKALKSVAGIYTNVVVEDIYGDIMKSDYTFELKENGEFKFVQKRSEGIESEEVVLVGKLSVDKNKNVTDVKLDSSVDFMSSGDSIFGVALPDDEKADLSEYYENQFYTELYNKILESGMSFNQDYMVIGLAGDYILMYKDGATRLGKDVVLDFLTQKDLYDLESTLAVVYGESLPTFETDYYFVKDADFDISTEEAKNDFISELQSGSYIVVTNYLGNAEMVGATISDVSGFDLTTAGTKSAVVKYQSAGSVVEKQVSYTVVEDQDGLPMNNVKEIEVVDSTKYDLDDVVYIEAGTELYTLSWKVEYRTYASSTRKYINIDQENCEGTTKVVDIVGYNKDQTGTQIVTVTYRGKQYKQLVFVYNDTVNPVVEAYALSGSQVVITKTANGAEYDYTIDYSSANIVLKKADGTTSKESLTAAQAIGLDQLQNYDNGDEIIFGYNYTYNNVVYTFYVSVEVVINVA